MKRFPPGPGRIGELKLWSTGHCSVTSALSFYWYYYYYFLFFFSQWILYLAGSIWLVHEAILLNTFGSLRKGGFPLRSHCAGQERINQSHLHKFYFVFLGTHCFCLRTSNHAVYSVPSILVSFKGYIAGSQVLAGNTALLVWRFMTAPLPPPFWGRERKLFMWGRTMIRYQASSSLF